MDETDVRAEILQALDAIEAKHDLASVRRRSRILKLRRALGVAIGVGLAAAAIAWPLGALSGLSSSRETGDGATGSALEVVCDGQSTTLKQSSVETQRKGVQVDVSNTSGENLTFLLSLAAGRNLPPGPSTFVFQLPPGSAQLACIQPRQNIATAEYQSFNVVDPSGAWISPDLSCEGGHGVGFEGLPVIANDRMDLVQAVRDNAVGLPDGASVEPAGYPAGDAAAIRAVSEGQVVGSFSFQRGSRGWELTGIMYCDGHEIGWR